MVQDLDLDIPLRLEPHAMSMYISDDGRLSLHDAEDLVSPSRVRWR